jgi:hypothetical protein
MNFQSARQTLQPTGARFTAYAGVDDLVSVTLGLQSLREQRYPTLLRPNTVGGAETVAEHEDRTAGRRHRVLERDE